MKRILILCLLSSSIFFFDACQKAEIPTAAFTYTGNAYTRGTLSFAAQMTNADFHHWDFGDGWGSGDDNPTHSYTQAGTYTVTLEVRSSTGHTTQYSQNIVVGTLPQKVTIHSVKLMNFSLRLPLFDWLWDAQSGPDVYFRIQKTISTVATSPAKNDVEGNDLPVIWDATTGIDLNNLESEIYYIDFYDDDGSGNLPDRILSHKLNWADDGYPFNGNKVVLQGKCNAASMNQFVGDYHIELDVTYTP